MVVVAKTGRRGRRDGGRRLLAVEFVPRRTLDFAARSIMEE